MAGEYSGKALTEITRSRSDFGGRKGKKRQANCRDTRKRNT